jgi:hypothetical protein
MLGMVLPGVVVWGIGIPFLGVNLLRAHKDELDSEKIKKELGFLYSGYKYSSYYWEMTIMTRKMVLIFVATFFATKGKTYQALMVQIVIAIFLVSHCYQKPFLNKAYNIMEGLSLIAAFVTMYAGYYFLAGSDSSEMTTTSSNDFKLSTWLEMIFFLCILVTQVNQIIFKYFHHFICMLKYLYIDRIYSDMAVPNIRRDK